MIHRSSLRVQFTAMLTLVAFLLATMAPVSAPAKPIPAAKPVPAAKGTQSLTSLVQATGASAAFTGVLSIGSFQVVNGVLSAVGTLTGTLTNTATGVVQTVTQAVTIPLASVSASCPILALTLGPLDLDLLGLVVHLNQVVLNITAVPGAGNLLGNLLCAVANLLNSGGPLSSLLGSLTNLLNQIVAAL